MSKLAENIKKYRKKQNLSQTDLADKLFVTKQAISKWENDRGLPDSSIIPELAKELGITIDELMGKRVSYQRPIIFASVVLLLALTAIIVSPSIMRKIEANELFKDYVTELENQTDIDFPSKGEVVTADFENWQQYGNYVSVDVMSYIIFSSSNELMVFEESLGEDSIWSLELTGEQLEDVPVNLQSYTEQGDYYLIHRTVVNDFKTNDMFLVYQLEHHRLLIFNYVTDIEGD